MQTASQADSLLHHAVALVQHGRLAEARGVCRQLLQMQPQNLTALNLSGTIALQMSDPAAALAAFDRAVQLDGSNAQLHFNRGNAYSMGGQNEAALACYDEAIRRDPDEATFYFARAFARLAIGRHADAITDFDEVITFKSDLDANSYYGRGCALLQLGKHSDALACLDESIALGTTLRLPAQIQRGLALLSLGEPARASMDFAAAIAVDPGNGEAWNFQGLALDRQGKHSEALHAYDQGLRLLPGSAQLHGNRGRALFQLGRHEEALRAFDAALAVDDTDADAHHDRGTTLDALTRFEAAAQSFDRANALKPTARSYNNRGLALHKLGHHEAALASFDRAIELESDHTEAYFNRGNLLANLKRHEDALTNYRRALQLNPSLPFLPGQILMSKLTLCEWDGLVEARNHLVESLDRSSTAVAPFCSLALLSSPVLQRRVASAWVAQRCPPSTALPPLQKRTRGDRIHVAYLSCDFYEHATAHLIAGLFEEHNRSRFRVTALSWGEHHGDRMLARLRAACEEFVDVSNMPDADVAMLARQLNVDIAIDLKGFTQDCRPGIFSLRAAPIQASYLGYPGTMAAPYIDYLIADRRVVPDESRQSYSERMAYLPNSYQVNDATRKIATSIPKRTDLGLPANAFVFCCFNASYKLNPEVFDHWMNILSRVPDSVLWLLDSGGTVVTNLRREAAARDINPERLVFAPHVPLAEHLARHQVADLCLDTSPYGMHTTASDALWAALPVVTCAGESFASRVAASLLTAVGLPELVTATPAEYAALAVTLATDRDRLSRIRQRLADARLRAPLFDTKAFTRDLEALYERMAARHDAALPPADLG